MVTCAEEHTAGQCDWNVRREERRHKWPALDWRSRGGLSEEVPCTPREPPSRITLSTPKAEPSLLIFVTCWEISEPGPLPSPLIPEVTHLYGREGTSASPAHAQARGLAGPSSDLQPSCSGRGSWALLSLPSWGPALPPK